MNFQEFEEALNAYDVDELTADIVYDICTKFKALSVSERGDITWEDLNDRLGKFKPNGEGLRCWVKHRQAEDGTITRNPRMLSDQTIEELDFDAYEEKVQNLRDELYKQQVKTRDTMCQYRKNLRETARVENFRDALAECAKRTPPLVKLPTKPIVHGVGNEAVLLFSDLHIGMQFQNFCNTFNTEVATERVSKLVEYVIRYCKMSNVRRLNVLLLGDFIHGIIHVNARLEQEFGIVEQIMFASQLIAKALEKLQEAAPEVIVRSCTDNHSRAVANLQENVERDNYSRLIDFYLEEKLKNTDIVFAHDNVDQEIGIVELMNGETLAFAHGHNDNYNQAVQNYCGMLKKYIKYICFAHFHSKKEKSFMGAKVIVNGSLCGIDSYAFSKRLGDDPEQVLLVFEDNNLIDYTINLK